MRDKRAGQQQVKQPTASNAQHSAVHHGGSAWISEQLRTFVAVAETGQLQKAAADLSRTQQAVSRRIAALERTLGTRLFALAARGAEPTTDGQAFLPHARELLRVTKRAGASVRPGHRPLRVDVIASRSGQSNPMRGFHRAHPEIDLDVMKLFDVETAVTAILSGAIDASFRAVAAPGRPLPEDIASVRVLDEPLQLLTGPAHALAGSPSVTVAQLTGHRIWMPGLAAGTEWPGTPATGLERRVAQSARGPASWGTRPAPGRRRGYAGTIVGGTLRRVYRVAAGVRRLAGVLLGGGRFPPRRAARPVAGVPRHGGTRTVS